MAIINSAYIKSILIQMNCCSATKGYNRILLLQKGEENKNILNTCELMVNLIDTLEPYAAIYSQSSYNFSVTTVANGNTLTLNINSVEIGTVTFTGTNTTTAANDIVNMINNEGTYIAISNTNSIEISGKDGSESNGYIIQFVTSGIILNTPAPIELQGGDDYLYRNTNTCLTLAQINNILQYLCKLCDSDCNYNLN